MFYETLKHLVPPKTRQALRVGIHFARHRRRELNRVMKSVRVGSLIDTLGCYEDFGYRKDGVLELSVRGVAEPMRLRNGTSDFEVFQQVFITKQYALPITAPVEYIIDAGANIGLASAYLLSRYPHARVIAIEPDSENIVMARQNLRQFGNRCHLLHAALWSSECSLAVRREGIGDGRHWATQTFPSNDADDKKVQARSLGSLLEEFDLPRIDFLKIDVEGAEEMIFGRGDTSFLAKTRMCAVECHGEACQLAFLQATEPYGFEISQSGELTVATQNEMASDDSYNQTPRAAAI